MTPSNDSIVADKVHTLISYNSRIDNNEIVTVISLLDY